MGVGSGLYMYVVVVQKFAFAISSPDEFLLLISGLNHKVCRCTRFHQLIPSTTFWTRTLPRLVSRGIFAYMVQNIPRGFRF